MPSTIWQQLVPGTSFPTHSTQTLSSNQGKENLKFLSSGMWYALWMGENHVLYSNHSFQWEFYWNYPVLSPQFHIGCFGSGPLRSLDCKEVCPHLMERKGQHLEILDLELELDLDYLPLERACKCTWQCMSRKKDMNRCWARNRL